MNELDVAAASLPDEINERIVRAGVRLSPARRAVLAALARQGGHFSREELALRLREEPGRRASLSTVYRFVRVLLELGIAREIRVGDTSRFEIDLGREAHDHLVCTSCGGISEFFDPRVAEVARAVAVEHGFANGDIHVELHGCCLVCAAAASARATAAGSEDGDPRSAPRQARRRG